MASGYCQSYKDTRKCLNYKRFQRLPRGLSFLRKNLALWGGGGGEVGLEKLCVPVEKFGLYTWKQQDLEVVILYKKFEWHPDSLIAVIYEKISLKFHVPVDMPNHPPGTGAQKWEVKDSFEATIRVKQSLMAIILKHLYLTNRDTDL